MLLLVLLLLLLPLLLLLLLLLLSLLLMFLLLRHLRTCCGAEFSIAKRSMKACPVRGDPFGLRCKELLRALRELSSGVASM